MKRTKWPQDWHTSPAKTRDVEISTENYGANTAAVILEDDDDSGLSKFDEKTTRKLTYMPSPSKTYTLWYKGRYMTITRTREKEGRYRDIENTLHVRFVCRSYEESYKIVTSTVLASLLVTTGCLSNYCKRPGGRIYLHKRIICRFGLRIRKSLGIRRLLAIHVAAVTTIGRVRLADQSAVWTPLYSTLAWKICFSMMRATFLPVKNGTMSAVFLSGVDIFLYVIQSACLAAFFNKHLDSMALLVRAKHPLSIVLLANSSWTSISSPFLESDWTMQVWALWSIISPRDASL